MKSPVVWLTDRQYAALPIPERALAQAASKVGVREHGINAGPWIARFLRSVGLGVGYPWCAALVSWCLLEAGCPKERLPKRRAAVRDWVLWAEREGRLERHPERGRLFFWLDGAHGHIGFVTEVVGTTIKTIEGNTNKAGSREGDGVYRRERHENNMATHVRHGYIDLGGLSS